MSPGGKVSLVFGDEVPPLLIQQKATSRPSPGGKDSLIFGDEVPIQPIEYKVSNRVPPGGKVNVVFGDQFSSSVAPLSVTGRNDSAPAPLSPKFDQSLHRSRTFQSSLFVDDASAAPLTPTKAAKRVIVPVKEDSLLSSPRPAKKQVGMADLSTMSSILKPPHLENIPSKTVKSSQSASISSPRAYAAGAYRPHQGFTAATTTSASSSNSNTGALVSPRSAKKMVSPRITPSMHFVMGAEQPASPARKERVPPGGYSAIPFL